MQIPAILLASKSKYKQDIYTLKYLGMRLWKKQKYYTMNAKKEEKKKPQNRKKAYPLGYCVHLDIVSICVKKRAIRIVTRTRGLTDLIVELGCGRPWEREGLEAAAGSQRQPLRTSAWHDGAQGSLTRGFDLVQRTVTPPGLPAMTSQ